jgi:hypothetical protein
MLSSRSKVAVTVGVLAAGLGLSRSVSATAVRIENDQSAVINGWNITAPNGVSLDITTSGNEIDIEKAANFTTPNESFQIGFQPVVGAVDPATSVDFTNETIFNGTGSAFGEFDFIIQNVGTANATFGGDIFTNAIGSAPGTLNAGKDMLTYLGNQPAGATASWGGGAGNDLEIVIPTGATFAFDEASIPGGGSVVPVPAAAWQSLVGLGGLGVFGLIRHRKMQRLAVR